MLACLKVQQPETIQRRPYFWVQGARFWAAEVEINCRLRRSSAGLTLAGQLVGFAKAAMLQLKPELNHPENTLAIEVALKITSADSAMCAAVYWAAYHIGPVT